MLAPARKTVLGLVLLASLLVALGSAHAAPACVTGATTTTCTFSYTGAAEAWVIPVGVTSATFDVLGAQGGNLPSCCAGGLGGEATTARSLTPGSSVEILVGGSNGFNGGGAGGAALNPTLNGAVGGGASDIRMGSCAASLTCALSDRARCRRWRRRWLRRRRWRRR